MDKFGKDALGIAVAVNIAIFAVLGSISFGGCLSDEAKPKDEVIIPMDFTVVTEENAADVLAEAPNAAAEAKPEPPPKAKPEPKPEPKPQPKPKPEPKPTPAPAPKPEPKPAPKAEPKQEVKKEPEKPKWKATSAKDIKKGKRVGPVTSGRKDRTRAPTAKALSAAEIQRLLNAGARPGNRNQVPPSKASRCYGAIQQVFRAACAGLEASPTGEAPILKVTFGAGGTVRGVALLQSSGDRAFDAQVLAACRKKVRRINGLSSGFLDQQEYVEVRVDVY